MFTSELTVTWRAVYSPHVSIKCLMAVGHYYIINISETIDKWTLLIDYRRTTRARAVCSTSVFASWHHHGIFSYVLSLRQRANASYTLILNALDYLALKNVGVYQVANNSFRSLFDLRSIVYYGDECSPNHAVPLDISCLWRFNTCRNKHTFSLSYIFFQRLCSTCIEFGLNRISSYLSGNVKHDIR